VLAALDGFAGALQAVAVLVKQLRDSARAHVIATLPQVLGQRLRVTLSEQIA
jgi:hypothetical protein